MSGPVPKTPTQRRNRSKPAGPATKTAPTGAPLSEAPTADPEWHSAAIEWFESLASSGQSYYYEPSDWATARVVAEFMSRALESGRRVPSALVATLMSMQDSLLTTEAARRKSRIELERGEQPAEDPKVAIMESYRAAAAGRTGH